LLPRVYVKILAKEIDAPARFGRRQVTQAPGWGTAYDEKQDLGRVEMVISV
jgi:hypothetical protein